MDVIIGLFALRLLLLICLNLSKTFTHSTGFSKGVKELNTISERSLPPSEKILLKIHLLVKF